MIASARAFRTTSAPGSLLRTASSAEASRTASAIVLLTLGLAAPVSNQFVHETDVRGDELANDRLRFSYRTGKGPESDLPLLHRRNEHIAIPEIERLAKIPRDRESSLRSDT